jgi:hypothetical protein
MYGLQVNVGSVSTPDWRWVHGSDMAVMRFNTIAEVEHEKSRYLAIKSTIFRVKEIEE